MEQTTRNLDLNWLLDDFVDRVVAIDRAVLLSADGLLMGRSHELSEEDGEHLSAVASAFQSLARGAARHFEGGAVRQTLVEMDNAFLFVMAAGRGACLATIAVRDADLGLVAYEMNRLVKRVGVNMSAPPRPAGAPNGGAHDRR
ncbi:roadblock/LC7 domain-containing protein [Amycolatopsis acidiphila]|uniref:Roadblock/LC7 domain-containing protein n=1 Tax=Amycolatopsis acidiphila TaxID=715473 RepID=A0A558A515_9PSEU|nr:roadblock/LC7 domain-containing protein [Amycolatopsis acidiphila]TVT19353.1 roadblock/LC7 domain-containing protein [Amycolatopsis acidiphila]UIJ61718.1 roadblock/LC7 domain-containing protein [Amycolatopsis acidiphila]GHG58237.1 dynein regulation protein LC7 [Amycolatopsis acidiphila]